MNKDIVRLDKKKFLKELLFQLTDSPYGEKRTVEETLDQATIKEEDNCCSGGNCSVCPDKCATCRKELKQSEEPNEYAKGYMAHKELMEAVEEPKEECKQGDILCGNVNCSTHDRGIKASTLPEKLDLEKRVARLEHLVKVLEMYV